MFANVWRKKDAAPFHPHDFLEQGHRERSERTFQREQAAVQAANAQLSLITRNTPPTDDIPEWARGPYQGAS